MLVLVNCGMSIEEGIIIEYQYVLNLSIKCTLIECCQM